MLTIHEIKKICKPIISQIKKWKDLQTLRSSFIAHNLRTKDKQMVFRNEINFDAPRGVFEVELLNNCIHLIMRIIDREFKSELEYIRANFKIRISTPKEFTKDDCWNIVDELIIKINQNLKNLNREYKINI
jgi:hypothetical protein